MKNRAVPFDEYEDPLIDGNTTRLDYGTTRRKWNGGRSNMVQKSGDLQRGYTSESLNHGEHQGSHGRVKDDRNDEIYGEHFTE